jgi:phosphoribosylformimino-5-aminoimidazole carboxamide ribotide isomerase
MILLPAIDLYEKKAVRLYKGDYAQMTVYSEKPLAVARDFASAGAEWIHLVDLEGARYGDTPNLEIVSEIVSETGLRAEIGGGIRRMETAQRYLEAGVRRVILGTAAVTDEGFLREALAAFGAAVAVGADVKDGYIAIRGWREQSAQTLEAFLSRMEELGVRTVICTDISRDGAMRGTNRALYRALSARFSMDLIASGGVSSLEDIRELREQGLYGAILGKAYYTGAVDLREALEAAR